FFVMSYVEGETLGERLRSRGPLPPVEAARVLREVAWALAYAHGRGIVHRDAQADPLGDPGKVMGTAHYMSPEQAAGEALDGRSDLYSLGVVGYLTVSGRLPFEAANLPALILKQATEESPSVMRVAPGLAPALGAAIDRCLARSPDE